MNILKLILFFSIIALGQQGLFFSLSASEYLEVKTVRASDNKTYMNQVLVGKVSEEEFSDENSRYERVNQYVERGLVDLAIPELKKMIEFHPDDVNAHAYLGWAYSQKGMLSDALGEFKKVLEINPDLQRMPFDYPMIKNIPDLVKEFTTRFEEVIDCIDMFPDAHAVLGLYYVQQGRLGDAVNEYKKALKGEPYYNRTSVENERETTSTVDQAIDEYEEDIKLKSDCAEVYMKLACAHAQKGILDQSIADMKQAISLEPNRRETHVYLAYFYAKKGMLGEAIRELDEAKKVRDRILEKSLTEAERCLSEGLFDKAISLGMDAMKVDARSHKAHWLIAIAYSKKGETDKAIEACKEIICLYPNDIQTYALLGWIYVQCDSFVEAAGLAERAIRINPENAELRALMAFIYASQEQIREAITMGNMIISKPSVNNDNIKDYSWIKGNMPSFEQKLREVKDVLEINPDYPEGHLCLGWLYSKNGEYEKAINSYKKAVELLSDSYYNNFQENFSQKRSAYSVMLYNVHRYLGNIYAQKGEMENALDEYAKALEVLYRKAHDDMTHGLTYFKMGDIDQAVACFNDALKVNPECDEAYFLLADAYTKKGMYSVGAALRLEGERLKQRMRK